MSTLIEKIKYPLIVVKQIALLPRQAHTVNQLRSDVVNLRNEKAALKEDLDEALKTVDDQKRSLHSVDDRLLAIKEVLKQGKPAATASANAVVNNTVADNHNLDHFYKQFEDKFRGSEEDIKKRVSEYLPVFKKLTPELKKKDIIDLGCGRGEFLSFAKDNKLKAIGVDMNKSMVDRAKALGYDAYENDAISYLTTRKQNSIAAVTGFHLVEHIPFESLVEMFEECYRTISPGGFVLFETPNPENVIVGSCNFHMDPSHIKPIPPDLLAFTLESVGFRAEIMRVHPVKEKIQHQDKIVQDIMGSIYGPRDYAVVAHKI